MSCQGKTQQWKPLYIFTEEMDKIKNPLEDGAYLHKIPFFMISQEKATPY